MSVKLRQITDSVHETIYLSELESEFISTPYFFRLHDVYQSSTVYMTYPSNRTKRYEHSIGTMELASDLLFSSVANADKETRTQLIKQLRKQFWKIYYNGFVKPNGVTAKYFTHCETTINEIIRNEYSKKEKDFHNEFESYVNKAFNSGILTDKTIERYQISSLFSEPDLSETGEDYTISQYNVFLFRCLFQAIRIVALFHDAGHPPYSHIIENVITELYEEIQSDLNNENNKDIPQVILDKKNDFIDYIKPYVVTDKESAYKASMLLTQSSLMSEFHERVGLALLQSAINDVIPLSVERIIRKDKEECINLVAILYYITVAEFAMCILVEENDFFKSFHRIVDGFVDADRLDYVVRDSDNSGVHWNRIPYKRVLESAKLFYDKKTGNGVFLLAFAKKNQRDIVDFLITRYKVFSWINYHHRCIRTSVALQSCVKTIALNYLNSTEIDDDVSLCPDIKTLWFALNGSQGNIETRIIRWNDSWLITTLQKTFIDLYKNPLKASKEKNLITDLEEIILNKKKLYAVIKRGSDSVELVKAIFDEAGIDEQLLDKIVNKEQAIIADSSKTYDPDKLMTNEKFNARDSIKQIERLRHILKTGNLEMFNTTMPLSTVSVDEIITNVLTKLESDGKILGFKTLKNTGRSKFGLPKVTNVTNDALENIYLFDNDSGPYPMDVSRALIPQLNIMSYDSPYMFIYIIPPDNKGNDKLSKAIIKEIAKGIGGKLRERFVQAFPNSTQEN